MQPLNNEEQKREEKAWDMGLFEVLSDKFKLQYNEKNLLSNSSESHYNTHTYMYVCMYMHVCDICTIN